MGVGLPDIGGWLADQFASQHNTVCIYSRGESQVSISMTTGNGSRQIVDTSGFVTEFQATDFLFKASALNFGAGVVEPAEGDVITFGGRQYQVLPVPGETHFRYSDEPHRQRIRVHTKLVDT